MNSVARQWTFLVFVLVAFLASDVLAEGRTGYSYPIQRTAQVSDQKKIPGAKRPPTPSQTARNENSYTLGISGILKYSHLKKIREHLSMTLPKGSTFYKNRISRGKVSFRLKTQMGMEELSQRLAGLPLDSQRVSVESLSMEDRTMSVRIE